MMRMISFMKRKRISVLPSFRWPFPGTGGAATDNQRSWLWAKGLLAGLLAVWTLTSCEKLLIEPNPANSPVQNFDLLWRSLDEKYAYFPLKRIDWDSVYTAFRPRVHNDMTDRELFKVMSDMLYLLRDGHTNLVSKFDVSRNWDWFLDYPQNFNFSVVERNYLGREHQIARPFRTAVIDSVGYIYYGSFLSVIDEQALDLLMEQYAGLKGIIIDVRSNGGGAIAMVDVLTARFVGEKTLVGYSRYKNGPGHNDFTEAYAKHIEPKGKHPFTKPVVVLTNRSVYSAANEFVSFMSHLPHVTLVGDTSGGGGGAPYSGELMNGWTYRFSSTQFFNADMEHIEEGVAPDIKVDIRPEDAAQGKDTILETALELLR
jgi:hypothetical protein